MVGIDSTTHRRNKIFLFQTWKNIVPSRYFEGQSAVHIFTYGLLMQCKATADSMGIEGLKALENIPVNVKVKVHSSQGVQGQ